MIKYFSLITQYQLFRKIQWYINEKDFIIIILIDSVNYHRYIIIGFITQGHLWEDTSRKLKMNK